MDYTVHGILQARILEYVAFPFSRGSSLHRDRTQVFQLQADFLPAEPQEKPKNTGMGSLSLFQWIFPTQELNWGLLHCRWIIYQLSYHGSPILREINPEYSLEGLMLKLQYFGHLMRRANSLEKTPMLGKIEGKRRRGCKRMRWLDSIINSMDMSLSKLPDSERQGNLVWCSSWGCKELDMTEQLNNNNTLILLGKKK